MDLLQAVILGLVEGVTEFLPISSTGHLIVISGWLSMDRTETQTAFEIIIQLAAILAVIASYGGKFTPSHIGLWQKIGLAFIPIGGVGFLFGDMIEALFSVPVVATTFIAGGIVLLVVERHYKAENAHVTCVEDLNWRQAAWIGVAQVFALVPGTSRAGATIVGALLVGLDRKASAEFSFLLALPVMTATTAYALIKHYQDFTEGGLVLLGAGFVTAFIVARLTMRWFIRFLARSTFVAFGVYRILLGLTLLIWFA